MGGQLELGRAFINSPSDGSRAPDAKTVQFRVCHASTSHHLEIRASRRAWLNPPSEIINPQHDGVLKVNSSRAVSTPGPFFLIKKEVHCMAVQKFSGENLPESLVDYIRKRAFRSAYSLVRCGFYRPDQLEDLRQDLLLDFLKRFLQFKSSRGNPYAFACLVIRNRASVLANRMSNWFERRIVALDQALLRPRRWRRVSGAEDWGFRPHVSS